MQDIKLNFFGEEIKIKMPDSLASLRKEIADKLNFSPSDAAEIVISYAKNVCTKVIETEQDFLNFLKEKINKLDLDISEGSQLFQNSMILMQQKTDDDADKLDKLLELHENNKKEQERYFNEQKQEVKNLDKQIAELNKTKLEKIREIHKNILKMKEEDKKMKIEIIDLQKKLDLPVTVKISSEKKSIPHKIVKKAKKLSKKITEKKENLFEKVNKVFSEAVKKVNELVKKEKALEQKEMQKTEEEIHQSKIVLKTDEKQGLFDIKKISENAFNELNKWTDFIGEKTNKLTNELNIKCTQCKNLLEPLKNQIFGTKREEEIKEIPEPVLQKAVENKNVHKNVMCDGCHKCPIIGNRYKCQICEDFDYCQECEEKLSEEHGHPFLKIYEPENETIPEKPKNSRVIEQTIHHGIMCDNCHKCPIVGNRFKCTVCDDFDYCEECEEKLSEKHGHPFLKIYDSENDKVPAKEKLCLGVNPKKELKPVHFRIRCDGCGACPIVGSRFKCTVCKNFDYCEKCEEKFSEEHNHPFLKIYNP